MDDENAADAAKTCRLGVTQQLAAIAPTTAVPTTENAATLLKLLESATCIAEFRKK